MLIIDPSDGVGLQHISLSHPILMPEAPKVGASDSSFIQLTIRRRAGLLLVKGSSSSSVSEVFLFSPLAPTGGCSCVWHVSKVTVKNNCDQFSQRSKTDWSKKKKNKRLSQFSSSLCGPVINWVREGLERFQGNDRLRIAPPTARRREINTETVPETERTKGKSAGCRNWFSRSGNH